MTIPRDGRPLEVPSLREIWVLSPYVRRRKLGWTAWVPRRWEWQVRHHGHIFTSGWAATKRGALRVAAREVAGR
jgi:hypothetical protein